jgi:hypothetical protein
MKKRKLLRIIMIVVLCLIFIPGIYAQQKYHLVDEKVKLKIKGTSNLHDWTMQAEKLTGNIYARLNGSSIETIKAGSIRVEVDEIQSGKRIMNNKTYDALRSDKHPYINFQLKSVDDMYSAGRNFSGKARGILTIAGQSRNVTIPVSGNIEDNSIIIDGDYLIKMTNYEVDPPTAMFGSLKTGDEVTVEYKLLFKTQSGFLTEETK